MDDFLQREREAGGFDSSGHFSLAVHESLAKLSRFQLRSREEGLLKLIQGIVRQNPGEIRFSAMSEPSVAPGRNRRIPGVSDDCSGFERRGSRPEPSRNQPACGWSSTASCFSPNRSRGICRACW
jgi:hypothetical protein